MTEPGRDKSEVFLDYRRYPETWPSPLDSNIVDPYSVDLLKAARSFSKGRSGARFALLRVWTHSHFYPLMLGYDNRTTSCFRDEVSRSWEWKFVCKDMPGSEWSMQQAVKLRIDPFRKQLGKQVITKRDILLVMGKDEEELKRYAVAATWAVQTRPWRMDVDLWKSFVNVDLPFLERLDKRWLE